MKCKHGYDVDANGNHIIIPIPKKYEVVENDTGIKYEVTEHPDELGYLHKNSKPIEPEVKPVSFKDIKRLYKKEFPNAVKIPPINEVKKLKQLIDNAL